MNISHIRNVFLLLAALVLASCGSETSGPTGSAKAADSSSTPSPTASESPAPRPSGTLATQPVPCKKFSAPAGFRPAAAMPPTCIFESSDASVVVKVDPTGPSAFEQLQQMEEMRAREKGVTPPALEQVTVPGWTFAAVWPELAGFNRMDRYLVDSAGKVLTCKVGVQGGRVDATTYADFCEGARSRLYTP